jgi:Bacterial regulatory helix-turn-helix protein, lysR family
VLRKKDGETDGNAPSFLAVARLLNFTRAAEECNVAQPSLTRAIKQLEEEFGHELFRRERNLTRIWPAHDAFSAAVLR